MNQIWLTVGSASQQISNLLIIYRLADGSAWKKDTLTATAALPSIRFQSRTNDGRVSTHISSLHVPAPPSSDGSAEPKEVARDIV